MGAIDRKGDPCQQQQKIRDFQNTCGCVSAQYYRHSINFAENHVYLKNKPILFFYIGSDSPNFHFFFMQLQMDKWNMRQFLSQNCSNCSYSWEKSVVRIASKINSLTYFQEKVWEYSVGQAIRYVNMAKTWCYLSESINSMVNNSCKDMLFALCTFLLRL